MTDTTRAELAPNGLPYDRSPLCENEWTERSKLLASLPSDIVGTVHPHIVARRRSDVGGGLGLYAMYGLRKGEVVWAERARGGPDMQATPRSRAWIEALPEKSRRAYCHFMYKTGDDEYQSLAEFNELPIEGYASVRTVDVSNYMNHSCDPTCWFVDGGDGFNGVMVASRDIRPWEEITYDYSTSEDCELTPEWDCACGFGSQCRGRVTPRDWADASLQDRYRGHFLPHIAERIARETSEASPAPLEPIAKEDLRRTWWLRLEAVPTPPVPETTVPEAFSRQRSERRCLMRRAASGASLELLNRQAAVLISHHRLHMDFADEMRGSPRVDESIDEGRVVQTGVPHDEGSLVMLLPPNALLWEEEVKDFNTCLQISPSTEDGARLFSDSITEYDLDNFICHSCDPNCEVVVGEDLAVGLVARRPIRAGESLTFDYDTTEDDLRGVRGGFACECGAPCCRRVVLGRLHSSLLDPDAPGSSSPAAP